MIALIQRVEKASVEIDGRIAAEIGSGILLFLCIEKGDDKKDVVWMRDKILSLRIFRNGEKHFDSSLSETGSSILIVSQFTLAGNCEKGRRPDFASSMPPQLAKEFYDDFIHLTKEIIGHEKVACGVFGADMKINSTNDGPATFVIEKRPI